jgi:hypothetical protein
MHEAIIEKELFNRINEILSKRRRANHKHENIFKGLVFCAECGAEMQLISAIRQKKSTPMFSCPQHALDKNVCTHHHFIYYDELIAETRKQLEKLLEEYVNSNKFENLCNSITERIASRILEKIKNDLHNELSTINKQIKEYYKNSAKNSTNQFYLYDLNDMLKIRTGLINKIANINCEKSNISDLPLIMSALLENMRNYVFNIVLSKNSLNKLVNKIEIGYLEKAENGVCQNVIIHLKF